jgi:hypothetical protein
MRDQIVATAGVMLIAGLAALGIAAALNANAARPAGAGGVRPAEDTGPGGDAFTDINLYTGSYQLVIPDGTQADPAITCGSTDDGSGYGFLCGTNFIGVAANGNMVAYFRSDKTFLRRALQDDGGPLELDDDVTVSGALIPSHVTADPCGTYGEGALFYNDTGNYQCFCDEAGADLKVSDGTACF